jgi:membrane protease YdiL (CAAX protease family)
MAAVAAALLLLEAMETRLAQVATEEMELHPLFLARLLLMPEVAAAFLKRRSEALAVLVEAGRAFLTLTLGRLVQTLVLLILAAVAEEVVALTQQVMAATEALES